MNEQKFKEARGALNFSQSLLDQHRAQEVSQMPQQMPQSTPQVQQRGFMDEIPGAAGDLLASSAQKTGQGLEMIGKTADNAFGLPGRVATGFNPAVPQGFSEQVGQASEQLTGNKGVGQVMGMAAGLAEPLGLPSKGAKVAKALPEVAKAFLKKAPPSGLLKDMEHFIDYVRIKTPHPDYGAEGGVRFEADIRDALAKHGIDPNQTNAEIANLSDEVLSRARHPLTQVQDIAGRFHPNITRVVSHLERPEQVRSLMKEPETVKLYRGSANGEGHWYTTSREWANNFAKGGEVKEIALPKGSKLHQITPEDFDAAHNAGIRTDKEAYDFIMKRHKVDALIGSDPMNSSIVEVILK